MNEEQSYAEMLEIPMESVTINRKERKRKAEADLQEQLVQEVNDRMQAQDDPAYAESTPIAREEAYSRRQTWGKRILLGEFIAVCVLCATIFFTNIFMPNSAINVWVRDLVQGSGRYGNRRFRYGRALVYGEGKRLFSRGRNVESGQR